MHKVYTLRTNVTFTAPDLTFQTHVSSFMRGKDVSPEMPINRGMEGKGEGGEGGEERKGGINIGDIMMAK